MEAAALFLPLAVVAVAVAVQSVTGSGFGVIAAPLLILLEPALVPGPLLLLTLVVMACAAWQDRRGLRQFDLSGALIGAAVGAVLGWISLPWMTPRTTSLVIGLVVTGGVLAGILGWKLRQGPVALMVAGAAAGVLSTLAATPGPPIVLVYERPDVVRFRANLAVFFLMVCVMSVVVLTVSGGLGVAEWRRASWLAPGIAGGLVLGGLLRRLVPDNAVRPTALGISLAAGIILIIKGV